MGLSEYVRAIRRHWWFLLVASLVAVIGAGPIGLSAVMTAQLYGPSRVVALALDEARLARAREFGATDTVDSSAADWRERVLALTDATAGR